MTESVPWVKWRFDRWRADEGLRMCGLAARGLWADLLAIMHGSTPYGHLAVKGQSPSPRQIASLVGMTTEKEVVQLLKELETSGVFSRSHDGLIYCRRMVRDNLAREKGKANGSLGGNPDLILPQPELVNGSAKKGLTDGLTQEEKEKEEERESPPYNPPPSSTRTKPRIQIPPDWKPNIDGVSYAKDRGLKPPDLAAFVDFHRSKGNVFSDIDAAWRTWCRNAVKFGTVASPALPKLPLDTAATAANPTGRPLSSMSGMP